MKRGEINDCSLPKTTDKRENEGENVERRERKTERNESQCKHKANIFFASIN